MPLWEITPINMNAVNAVNLPAHSDAYRGRAKQVNYAQNLRHWIFLDSMVVLVRFPGFHQLPGTAVGRVANIIMIS